MLMYHPRRFCCKKISSSADKVKFDQMSPHCDPELEDSEPIFLHDTLAHDDASPYQVWLQRVQQLRIYYPDEHLLEFWTFPVTLTLTTTEQSNLFTWQSSSWLGAIKPNYLSRKNDQRFRWFIRKSSLVTWTLTLTLTLNTANQILRKTIWLMMMLRRTKFGSIRFSISEDSIWINVIDILNPWPWPLT